MEAMFWGKPLLHAHFARSAPTMPFVDFGAAFPGFSPAQLASSLDHAARLTRAERDDLLAGQTAFLADFAGPCDGQASRRVVEFITDILDARTGGARNESLP
jgi:hypothetical protein